MGGVVEEVEVRFVSRGPQQGPVLGMEHTIMPNLLLLPFLPLLPRNMLCRHYEPSFLPSFSPNFSAASDCMQQAILIIAQVVALYGLPRTSEKHVTLKYIRFGTFSPQLQFQFPINTDRPTDR